MKKIALKLARSWWTRQALKFTAYLSGAASVALAKVSFTVNGTTIDPLSADNEAVIATAVAALVAGGVEAGLSYLAAKDAKETRETLGIGEGDYRDITPSDFR